jgi:hypothetical protein
MSLSSRTASGITGPPLRRPPNRSAAPPHSISARISRRSRPCSVDRRRLSRVLRRRTGTSRHVGRETRISLCADRDRGPCHRRFLRLRRRRQRRCARCRRRRNRRPRMTSPEPTGHPVEHGSILDLIQGTPVGDALATPLPSTPLEALQNSPLGPFLDTPLCDLPPLPALPALPPPPPNPVEAYWRAKGCPDCRAWTSCSSRSPTSPGVSAPAVRLVRSDVPPRHVLGHDRPGDVAAHVGTEGARPDLAEPGSPGGAVAGPAGSQLLLVYLILSSML